MEQLTFSCVFENFDDPLTKLLNEFDITYESVKNEYSNYLLKKKKQDENIFKGSLSEDDSHERENQKVGLANKNLNLNPLLQF